jgi:hypothetical protein
MKLRPTHRDDAGVDEGGRLGCIRWRLKLHVETEKALGIPTTGLLSLFGLEVADLVHLENGSSRIGPITRQRCGGGCRRDRKAPLTADSTRPDGRTSRFVEQSCSC